MATPLVMTFLGRDRPGLVNAISRKIAENDGTWLESRLAHLAGQFAGIIRVEAPDERIADLAEALRELEAHGLRVTVERGSAAPKTGATLNIELLCLDRPGIVRDVTETLTQLGVNIEEFESGLQDAAFTGAPMFHAEARLSAPEGLAVEDLRKALERLANEMMADITVSAGRGNGGVIAARIGPREVIALEKQRRVECFRQRVTEAIADIEPCRISALAETAEGLDRGVRMRRRDRRDFETALADQPRHDSAAGVAFSTLDDERQLNARDRGDNPPRRRRQQESEAIRLGFIEQNRDQGGRVDDNHRQRPSSP